MFDDMLYFKRETIAESALGYVSETGYKWKSNLFQYPSDRFNVFKTATNQMQVI